MKTQDSTTETMAIERVIAETPSVALLDPKKKEELYAFLEREIEAFVPDLSTETSRKQIASLAYRVSRTKTAIDDAGALLKSEWLKKSQAIDVSRKEIREKLDALRDKARKPLTDWEAAEEERRAFIHAMFQKFRSVIIVRADDTAETVMTMLRLTEDEALDPAVFQDLLQDVAAEKAAAVASLKASLARIQQQEAEKAELTRLRTESAARVEADRKAAEAAEVARLDKERADREAARIAEMEAAAKLAEDQRIAKEAAAIAQAAKDAEEKARRQAEQVAQEAAEKIRLAHVEELEKARKAQEAAERKQREEAERAARIEADRKAEAARVAAEADRKAKEEAKIAANKKHRAAVMTAAKVALMEHCGLDEDTARKVVLALSTDKIPAVTWSWL